MNSIGSASEELSPGVVPQPSLKRKRVARACQNCRMQKSKCDGKRPVCNRCAGYGHVCTWADSKRHRSQGPENGAGDTSIMADPKSTPFSLHKIIRLYHSVIKRVRPKLPSSDRAAVDLAMSCVRDQLPEDVVSSLSPFSIESSTADSEPSAAPGTECQNAERQRFLGQASDLWFFHAVRGILQDGDQLRITDNIIQSYDPHVPLPRHGKAPELPTRELADRYVEIYFFTIHIAYPFLSKASFMTNYEKVFDDQSELDIEAESSWLSLLYTIFAIGAYYTSFPRLDNTDHPRHLQYFEHAMSLCDSTMTECSFANVQTLLSQCFFLLATGQSDRSWVTLGLAIRVGQSVGLHVDSLKRVVVDTDAEKQETMRRTWYSMYVLDRLIALQLGRPVAIHEGEFCVDLPSRGGESVSGNDGHDPSGVTNGPSSLDYFLSVITFSRVLGQVISDLYSPSQAEVDPDKMLLRTTSLDHKLLEWKMNLSRHLRFDLGHTFEQSIVFKRQRNMLAIKFHHLRALIHRPYLCLTFLQRDNSSLMSLLQRSHPQVERFEKTCVLEAQETAHLLHNVADEKDLVHDFPWWQMISCLLCASSILLVASACIKVDEVSTELKAQMLNEDAETCLKVFDALSTNSDAARRARDMMKGLKGTRILLNNLPSGASGRLELGETTVDTGVCLPVANVGRENLNPPVQYRPDSDPESQAWFSWPGELSDPMAWSAQFLGSAQTLYYDGMPMNTEGLPEFL